MKIAAVLKNIKMAYKDTRYIKKTIRQSNSGMANIMKYDEAWFHQMQYGKANPSFFRIFRQKLRDLTIM